MRILIVNKKEDRLFITSLMSELLIRGVSIGRDGIFVYFNVDDIANFLGAVWNVYSDLSRDGRGSVIEIRRFFKVDDNPNTFWYELRKEDDTFVGIQYGRL